MESKRDMILADNQELTRLGLKALLSGIVDSSVSIVEDKAALIEKLKANSHVIVLIDFTLFDFADEDNLLIVVERFPDTRWILISDDLNQASIKKFVYGSKHISIVFKDTPLYIIREAVKVTLSGSRYICQHATEMLIAAQQDEQQSPTVSTLTATELAILTAIAQGKTTKEIAADRNSSIHTINTHRKNIFRKLNVNTAHEAVKYAFRAGIINTEEFYI
jgi:DNA-binding NarL/FixJ family response regulator